MHIAQFLGIGGLEKIIFHLAIEQMRLGHEVSVYIYDWEREWVSFFRESGINVITPPLKKEGYDFSLLRRIKHDIKGQDIIHTHDLNPLMYLAPIKAMSILSKLHPKLIHTTHGLDHLENYPRSNFYEKMVSPLADQIIGVSQSVYDYYTTKLGIPKHKVHRVDNGVQIFDNKVTTELKSAKKKELCNKYNLDESKPIISNVARVVPLKDQAFLMNEISKNKNVQLLIIGPSGDEKYYKSLESLQTENCKMTGGQSGINDLLLGSDLFVSASTHEGIPVAVLEAMGISTPCLISDIPGHSIIKDKAPRSVCTYKLGSSEDFNIKLNEILSSTQKQDELAQYGKEAVINHFSVMAMNKHYLEIYKS